MAEPPPAVERLWGRRGAAELPSFGGSEKQVLVERERQI